MKPFNQEKWNRYSVVFSIVLSVLVLIIGLIILISKAVAVVAGGG